MYELSLDIELHEVEVNSRLNESHNKSKFLLRQSNGTQFYGIYRCAISNSII